MLILNILKEHFVSFRMVLYTKYFCIISDIHMENLPPTCCPIAKKRFYYRLSYHRFYAFPLILFLKLMKQSGRQKIIRKQLRIIWVLRKIQRYSGLLFFNLITLIKRLHTHTYTHTHYIINAFINYIILCLY